MGVWTHGAGHEQEEYVTDDEILRQEQDTFDTQQQDRLNFNHQGIRSNNFQQHNLCVNDDPFAKVKFTIPYHLLRVLMMLKGI